MGILKDAIKKVALAGLAGGILIVISMGIVEYIYPHVHGTIGMIILLLILAVFCIVALTDDTIILRVVELPLGGLALVPESLVNPAVALIAFIILLVIVLFVAAIILTVLVMAALFAVMELAYFLIFSGILYPFAKKFGGEGSFAEQTYAMSSYFSPLILIVSAVVSSQILFSLTDAITVIVAVIITICSLYPLTLMLKKAHKYDTRSALLTWLLPTMVYICGLAVVFIMYPNLLGNI